MAGIEFVEHLLVAHVPELANPANHLEVPLSVRLDPLTGHTSRIVTGTKLSPSERPDLTELIAKPSFCPFCADRINTATGTFPPQICLEGRIRRGSAVIVPNVMAYSEYSSVGLYDTERHFVDLPDLTPRLLRDLLFGFVEYTRAISRSTTTTSAPPFSEIWSHGPKRGRVGCRTGTPCWPRSRVDRVGSAVADGLRS